VVGEPCGGLEWCGRLAGVWSEAKMMEVVSVCRRSIKGDNRGKRERRGWRTYLGLSGGKGGGGEDGS
jgi:hypothetical protein